MDALFFLFLFLLSSNFSFNIVEGLKAEKINGGSIVRKVDFKYVAAIMFELEQLPDDNPCTGAIIHDFFIATVAHCFYNRPFPELRQGHFYIAVGVRDVSKPINFPNRIFIDRIYIHAAYNPHLPDSYDTEGNLAIVKLETSLAVAINPYLSMLVIRQQGLLNHAGSYNAIGYGYHEVQLLEEEINGEIYYRQDGKTDGLLRYAKAKVLNDSTCNANLPNNLARGNMCAKIQRTNPDKAAGICKGDSGAPLTHKAYLDGLAIINFLPCDEELMPAIYIDVMYYSRFITSVLDGRITHEMNIYDLVEHQTNKFMFRKKVYNLANQNS